MKKILILNINGMMCKHCQAHVNDCLSAMPEVKKVKVNLEDKQAIITVDTEDMISFNQKVVNEIKELGYELISIEEK